MTGREEADVAPCCAVVAFDEVFGRDLAARAVALDVSSKLGDEGFEPREGSAQRGAEYEVGVELGAFRVDTLHSSLAEGRASTLCT